MLVAILVEKEDPRRSHLLFHVDLLKELLLTAASETHMPLGCIKDLLQHKLPQSADSVTYRALEAPGPVKSVELSTSSPFLDLDKGYLLCLVFPSASTADIWKLQGDGMLVHPSIHPPI